jgi:hypothetical protein
VCSSCPHPLLLRNHPETRDYSAPVLVAQALEGAFPALSESGVLIRHGRWQTRRFRFLISACRNPDIGRSPLALWHRPGPYRMIGVTVVGATDAANEMVGHLRHRHFGNPSDSGSIRRCRDGLQAEHSTSRSFPSRDRRELLGDVAVTISAGSWPCSYPAPARQARAVWRSAGRFSLSSVSRWSEKAIAAGGCPYTWPAPGHWHR